MELQAFPKIIQPHLLPKINGRLEYTCLHCRQNHSIEHCSTPARPAAGSY